MFNRIKSDAFAHLFSSGYKKQKDFEVFELVLLNIYCILFKQNEPTVMT